MGSTHLWNSDNPSYWNYGINSMILPFGITGFRSLRSYWRSCLLELRNLGVYKITNDPSFRNYGINTVVELRQSFLLELWDQVFMELPMILPFRIMGSTHLWKSDNPSYWNYWINTSMELRQSFLLELRDQFFMELSMILPFGITGFRSLWSY